LNTCSEHDHDEILLGFGDEKENSYMGKKLIGQYSFVLKTTRCIVSLLAGSVIILSVLEKYGMKIWMSLKYLNIRSSGELLEINFGFP
jgi:hypothetical protein